MDAAHTPTEKVARIILPVDTKNVGRLIQVSPVKEAAGTIPPSPNEKQASTNLQTSVEKEAGSILPAAKEGHITLAEPSNRIQQGSPMPNWPATATRKSRTSDNTHDDDYGSCIHAGLLLRAGLQQIVVWRNYNVGTPRKANREDRHSHLPPCSEWRPRVRYTVLATNHSI